MCSALNEYCTTNYNLLYGFPLDHNDKPSVAVPSVTTDGEEEQQTTGECIYSSFIMNCVNVVLLILDFITIIPNFFLQFLPW